MLKKIGLSAIALTAMLVLLAPAPASAQVRFGVTIGGPTYAYPYYGDRYYANPYPDYYYSYPAPTYVYPAPRYVSPYYYNYGRRDRERHEWLERERHREHEWREHQQREFRERRRR